MKKYLNKSIFYQGDLNLLPLFLAASVIWAIVTNIMYSQWGNNHIQKILYNQNMDFFATPFSIGYIVLVTIILSIVFFITVGNKRKKWKQLMIDKFTRKDIRNREMILIYGLLLIFFIIMLISASIFYIQNKTWLNYTNIFFESLIIDIVRFIVLGFLGVTVLFLLDSFVVNNIASITLMAFIFGYVFVMLLYFMEMFSEYIYYDRINIFVQIIHVTFENFMNRGYMRLFSIVFAFYSVLAIVLFYLVRRITNKIKVENMSGFFVVNFNRSWIIFMLATFMARIITWIIQVILEISTYNYLHRSTNLIIFSIISFVLYIVLKKRNGVIMSFIKG